MRDLHTSLAQLRHGDADIPALVAHWRQAAEQWPGLPPRYTQVLAQLLAPLEASALFSEESCSFSRSDLADNLAQWLDAAERVAPGA